MNESEEQIGETKKEPNTIESSNEKEKLKKIDEATQKIVTLRNRPLLVLYYPGPYGEVRDEDVRYCYRAFRDANIAIELPLPQCDVLLHTYGGNPIAAYKMAQVIRDFSLSVDCLVPEYAYSAGTLFCFCGNKIRLGHYAGLSPIDITQEDVELASIDNYIEFASDCQEKIQHAAAVKNPKNVIRVCNRITIASCGIPCYNLEHGYTFDQTAI